MQLADYTTVEIPGIGGIRSGIPNDLDRRLIIGCGLIVTPGQHAMMRQIATVDDVGNPPRTQEDCLQLLTGDTEFKVAVASNSKRAAIIAVIRGKILAIHPAFIATLNKEQGQWELKFIRAFPKYPGYIEVQVPNGKVLLSAVLRPGQGVEFRESEVILSTASSVPAEGPVLVAGGMANPVSEIEITSIIIEQVQKKLVAVTGSGEYAFDEENGTWKLHRGSNGHRALTRTSTRRRFALTTELRMVEIDA